MQYLSFGISVLALLISGATLWLSHLRRGVLKMTQPTIVFFGPDGGADGTSKIYLRTLLYSTAKRGVVIEHLYIRLRRGETQQNFSIWVYGDGGLKRGSGLFVGQEGIATSHHFLIPEDVGTFDFIAGDYVLEVFGKTVAQDNVSLLSTILLKIDSNEAKELRQKENGIYFDWGPDAGRYTTHIDRKPIKNSDPLALHRA